MKRFLLLTAVAILCLQQPGNAASEFFLRIQRTGRYTVTFADQVQFTPSNRFRFFDLMPGNYAIRVVDEATRLTIFTGTVQLAENVRTTADLDHYGMLRISQNQLVQQDHYSGNPWNGNGQWNNNGWGNSNNGSWGNNGQWNGNNGGWGQNSSWNNNATCDAGSFAALRKYVKEQSFDDSRLSAAQEVTRTHRLSASQVADLCALFSFDSNRLKYAMYAYDYVADRNNFFCVYETFTFSSNADDLRRYVAGR